MCTAKKNGTRQHDMLHSFNWCQINWILPRSPATATIAARTEQLASGRALADDDCPPGGVLAGGCALWLRLWLTVALWLVGWPTDWPTDSLSVRQHLLSESTSIDCVYVACAYEYLHCLPLAQYNAFASFNCSLLLLWHLLPTFFFLVRLKCSAVGSKCVSSFTISTACCHNYLQFIACVSNAASASLNSTNNNCQCERSLWSPLSKRAAISVCQFTSVRFVVVLYIGMWNGVCFCVGYIQHSSRFL